MARIIDQVRGHEAILQSMMAGFNSQRPGQTWLFVGPSGVGKKLVAMGLAQALVCETSRTACGRCPACLRVASGQSESILVIQKDSAQIKVEQADLVIQFFQLALLGKSRIVIIDDVQAMNPQAANSLLKILEEPPENTYFFLIAPSTAGILPTIRSRSRSVYFHPLTLKELGQVQTAPDWALKAATGSVEKLKLLLDPDEQLLRSQAAKMLENFCKDSDFLLDSSWKENLKDRMSSARILSYWASYARDALVFNQGGKNLLQNPDQLPMIKSLAAMDHRWLLKFVDSVIALEPEVARNLDTQLSFESFWVQMKKGELNAVMD